MIATDDVRPVTSSLANLRELGLAEITALSAEVVGQTLGRILPGESVAAPELSRFNSCI